VQHGTAVGEGVFDVIHTRRLQSETRWRLLLLAAVVLLYNLSDEEGAYEKKETKCRHFLCHSRKNLFLSSL